MATVDENRTGLAEDEIAYIMQLRRVPLLTLEEEITHH